MLYGRRSIFDSPAVPMLGVLAFAAIAAGVVMGGEALTANTVRDRATTDARAYTRALHPAWPRAVVVCQGVDSDGDGYVTCTVGNGADETDAIECRSSLVFDYQRGCRPMRAVLRSERGR